MYQYERDLLQFINNLKNEIKAQPLYLGGISGEAGGDGGPPAGFVGRLIQSRVAYDETELATDTTPISGASLVDNLNHIRYRLGVVESGVVTSGDGGHLIQSSGVDFTQRAKLNFVGVGVTVTDDLVNNSTVVNIPKGIDYSVITVVAPDNMSVTYPATVAGLEESIAAAVGGSFIYLPAVTFDISTATGGVLTWTGKTLSFIGRHEELYNTFIKNDVSGRLFDISGSYDNTFVNCSFRSQATTAIDVRILQSLTGYVGVSFYNCGIVSTAPAGQLAWLLDLDTTLAGNIYLYNSGAYIWSDDGDVLGMLNNETGNSTQTVEIFNNSYVEADTLGGVYSDNSMILATATVVTQNRLEISSYFISDRAGWVADSFHAKDIFNSSLTRHLPAPSAAGMTVLSSGSPDVYWVERLINQETVVTKSGDYTASATDQIIRFTATATLTLPAATGNGTTYSVIADGAGITVTVDGNGSETINRQLTQTLSDGNSMVLHDTGAGIWNTG